MRGRVLAWIGVLAATTGVALLDRGNGGGDTAFFLHAGEALLSADWAQAYANPAVQSGPLQLAAFGLAQWISWPAASLLLQVGGTALLVLSLLRVLGPRGVSPAWIVAGFGAAVVLLGLPHDAVTAGHPAHLIVPALWLLAGAEARRGRVLTAGALVGLAGAWETWGLLGVAVLVLAPRARAAAAGVAVAAATCLTLFLPFVLAGDFAMGEYVWRVSDRSLAGLVLDPGSSFSWSLRLVQAALAVGAGAMLAWALRRTGHAVPAALVAVAAVRLAFDPAFFSWYWVSLLVLVLALGAELATSTRMQAVVRARSSWRAELPMGSS